MHIETESRLAQAEPARAYARVQTRVREYDFQILSYDVKFIKQNWKETLYTFGLFKYFEWILLSILQMLQGKFTCIKYKSRLLILYNLNSNVGQNFKFRDSKNDWLLWSNNVLYFAKKGKKRNVSRFALRARAKFRWLRASAFARALAGLSKTMKILWKN